MQENRSRANQNKEAKKEKAFATSSRSSYISSKNEILVADLIRGVDVQKALDMLKFCPEEEAARSVEKSLLSGNRQPGTKERG